MLSYKDFLNTLVKPDSSSRLPPTLLENIDPEGIWSKYQTKVPQAIAESSEGLQLSMIFPEKKNLRRFGI